MDDATRLRTQQQAPFEVRLDWGPHGLRTLGPVVDVVVLVDVLSFSTAVTVAVEQGAAVLPYRWHADATARRDPDDPGSGPPSAADFAASRRALLAGSPRRLDVPSLSPSSLQGIGPGERIVLPSANGSALAFAARDDHDAVVVAACLRNATAVAGWVARRLAVGDRGDDGDRTGAVGIVAAGERWRGATGPMRVALEDLLGAGAVVDALPEPLRRSGEAAAAAAAFRDARDDLYDRIAQTASGRELLEAGFGADVLLAGAHDVTDAVPVLRAEAFEAT